MPNAMYHCRSEFESSVTNTVMNSVKWSKSSGSEPLGFFSFCGVLRLISPILFFGVGVSSFSKKQWSRSSPEPLEFRVFEVEFP